MEETNECLYGSLWTPDGWYFTMLALPDDESKEGRMRKQLRDWAISSYKNAVNPDSPDCLLWEGPTQILVDAAYIAESFMRAPEATWNRLDR